MKEVYLSVIVPSYNEMANLQKGVLDKITHFFNTKRYAYEIIIVDDGSSDKSDIFVENFIKHASFPVKLIRNAHQGKAGAVTTGVLQAVGEYILFTDMDQATPIEEIDKLIPFFNKGYDIVIGSRGMVRRDAPWTRRLMANGMIFLRKLIVGVRGILDTQCGFKVFKRTAAKKIFTKVNDIHKGFQAMSGSNVTAGFDVEVLHIAQKMGYKIMEVPVEWLYVETRRVNPIIDSIEGFVELFRIRLNDLNRVYDS